MVFIMGKLPCKMNHENVVDFKLQIHGMAITQSWQLLNLQ